jgi:hypothetical protein
MAAVTQIRHRHSSGRAYFDRKIAEGHSGKEAIRALKRRISDAIYSRLRDDAAEAGRFNSMGPGGQPGTTLKPARPAHTPNTGSSVKPLPDPPPPYDRQPTVLAPQRRTHHRPLSERPLDKQRGLVRNHVDDPTAGRLLAIASGTSTSPHSESAPANDEPLTVWLGRCGIPVRLRDRP